MMGTLYGIYFAQYCNLKRGQVKGKASFITSGYQGT